MTHDDLETLLPWYANQTCTSEERQRVDAARTDDPAVDREAAELSEIALAVQALHERTPQPSPLLHARVTAAIQDAAPRKRSVSWKWAALAGPLAAIFILAIVQMNRPADHRYAGMTVPTGVNPVVAKVEVPTNVPAHPMKVKSEAGLAAPYGRTENGLPDAAGAPPPPKPLVVHPPQAVAQGSAGSAPQRAAAAAPRGAAAPRNVAIARTAQVTLTVADVDAALQGIETLARSNGGDVLNLEYTAPARADLHHSASLQVRVDAQRFDGAMNGLAGIGTVTSRTVKAEDVRDQIVDGNARLRNLRQTETDLLRIMRRSGAISDVLEAENQISTVRGQIEELQAQLAALNGRVSYSTIDLTVGDDHPSAVEPTSASIPTAWAGAVEQVRQFTIAFIGASFTVIVFLPYIALAALAVFGIVAGVRRLRRDR